MPEKKLPLSYIHEKRRVVFLKTPPIKECWKAEEIAEKKAKGEEVSEKIKCPFFRVLNHKGVCIGNRKQRRGEGCR